MLPLCFEIEKPAGRPVSLLAPETPDPAPAAGKATKFSVSIIAA